MTPPASRLSPPGRRVTSHASRNYVNASIISARRTARGDDSFRSRSQIGGLDAGRAPVLGAALRPALAALTRLGVGLLRIEREARDCAISMHLSNFHPRSWSFTRDLAAIRCVIELERSVVRRAIETLGLRAVSIRYEELVASPERELRRVLDLFGLGFDPAVLRPEENRRSVLTLSFEQVRQPIHAGSVGRWRNYAKAFDASWSTGAGS